MPERDVAICILQYQCDQSQRVSVNERVLICVAWSRDRRAWQRILDWATTGLREAKTNQALLK